MMLRKTLVSVVTLAAMAAFVSPAMAQPGVYQSPTQNDIQAYPPAGPQDQMDPDNGDPSQADPSYPQGYDDSYADPQAAIVAPTYVAPGPSIYINAGFGGPAWGPGWNRPAYYGNNFHAAPHFSAPSGGSRTGGSHAGGGHHR